MTRKIMAVIFAALTVLCAVSGCDIKNSVSEIKDIEKKKKKDFPVKAGYCEIEEEPESVVVLDDNAADILIACGYADKIKGRSAECSQIELEDVRELGTVLKPETDKIKKLKADIVFVSTRTDYRIYEKIKSENKHVLRISDADSFDDFKNVYTNICRIMSGNIKGEKIGEEKCSDIMNSVRRFESDIVVRGCYIYGLDGKSAVTPDMYGNEVLSLAGVKNIAAEDDLGGNMNISRIVNADKQEGFPFYILCSEGLRSEILNNEQLKSTNAVRKNRVIEIPAEYFTRQGKTAVRGLQYIVSAIKSQSSSSGKNVAEDYGIEITDDMYFTVESEGDAVMAIQKRLDDLGYLPIKPTGYFGESTADAVKSFQVNNELDRRDGIADTETLKRLFSTSAFSSTSQARKSEKPAQQSTEVSTFSTTIVNR